MRQVDGEKQIFREPFVSRPLGAFYLHADGEARSVAQCLYRNWRSDNVFFIIALTSFPFRPISEWTPHIENDAPHREIETISPPRNAQNFKHAREERIDENVLVVFGAIASTTAFTQQQKKRNNNEKAKSRFDVGCGFFVGVCAAPAGQFYLCIYSIMAATRHPWRAHNGG